MAILYKYILLFMYISLLKVLEINCFVMFVLLISVKTLLRMLRTEALDSLVTIYRMNPFKVEKLIYYDSLPCFIKDQIYIFIK